MGRIELPLQDPQPRVLPLYYIPMQNGAHFQRLLSNEASEMEIYFHFRASDDIKEVFAPRFAAEPERVQGLPWGEYQFIYFQNPVGYRLFKTNSADHP
jgi:hypothetical protein